MEQKIISKPCSMNLPLALLLSWEQNKLGILKTILYILPQLRGCVVLPY